MNRRKLLYIAGASVLLITGVTTAVIAHNAPDTTTKIVSQAPKKPAPVPKVMDDTVVVTTTTPAPVRETTPAPPVPTEPTVDPIELLHRRVIQQATATGTVLRQPDLNAFVENQWACLGRAAANTDPDALMSVITPIPAQDGMMTYRYFDGRGSCRVTELVR